MSSINRLAAATAIALAAPLAGAQRGFGRALAAGEYGRYAARHSGPGSWQSGGILRDESDPSKVGAGVNMKFIRHRAAAVALSRGFLTAGART